MNKYLKYSIGKQLAYESEKRKGKESDVFFFPLSSQFSASLSIRTTGLSWPQYNWDVMFCSFPCLWAGLMVLCRTPHSYVGFSITSLLGPVHSWKGCWGLLTELAQCGNSISQHYQHRVGIRCVQKNLHTMQEIQGRPLHWEKHYSLKCPPGRGRSLRVSAGSFLPLVDLHPVYF